jgi:hypothetical protein
MPVPFSKFVSFTTILCCQLLNIYKHHMSDQITAGEFRDHLPHAPYASWSYNGLSVHG